MIDERPLRILVGADVPPNPDSGAAGTVFQMNQALRGLGHEVHEIWAADLGRRIKHGNLHYILELPFAYRREIRKMMRRNEYDVVELNQPHAWLAAADFRRSGCPGVFVNRSHGHEVRFSELESSWRPIQKRSPGITQRLCSDLVRRRIAFHWNRVIKHSDGIIVSCDQDAGFLETRYGLRRDRIAVINQGVPDEYLERPVKPMTPERMRNIIYAGNFVACKGPFILAECIVELLTANPELRFSWVCDARDHAKALELIDSKVRHQIRMIDWMPQSQLIRLYDEHGLLLFPSFFEGFGKVPLEAMSRGLCVIANDLGGMSDYIKHGTNGFLTQPGDRSAIIEYATKLLGSSELASRVGREATKTAFRYSWARSAEHAVRFYRDCAVQKLARIRGKG
ncbi:glycosyltransferase family 4 protein [Stieleria varia]|uniref:D-inositol 3-phosphate glycosyltransferase n=2 Tax=Stieleria varia TaxID=2528005 RepID=A0A5C6B0K4_9BACT|nr:glycosyltransferase family 4 protein [Stieleria varia]TWU04989.1 D-inositol 3-phosphate glycosyltransferase [Stieleria varia]